MPGYVDHLTFAGARRRLGHHPRNSSSDQSSGTGLISAYWKGVVPLPPIPVIGVVGFSWQTFWEPVGNCAREKTVA